MRNDPSRNIVGEDQEFLTSDAKKQHFKDRCIKIFVHCVFGQFWGARKNEQYFVAEHHDWELWVAVSLYKQW